MFVNGIDMSSLYNLSKYDSKANMILFQKASKGKETDKTRTATVMV